MSPRWLHWPAAADSDADYTIVLENIATGFSGSNVIDDGGIGFLSARLDSDKVRIRFSDESARDTFAANFSASVSDAVISNPSDLLIYDNDGTSLIPAGEWDASSTVTDIQFTYSTGLTYSSGQITIELYISGAPS
jgi:hypothetical protein